MAGLGYYIRIHLISQAFFFIEITERRQLFSCGWWLRGKLKTET